LNRARTWTSARFPRSAAACGGTSSFENPAHMFDVEPQSAAWSIAQANASKLARVCADPLLADAEHARDRGGVDISMGRCCANEVRYSASEYLEILRMQSEASDLAASRAIHLSIRRNTRRK
jgi:hypothetical protein